MLPVITSLALGQTGALSASGLPAAAVQEATQAASLASADCSCEAERFFGMQDIPPVLPALASLALGQAGSLSASGLPAAAVQEATQAASIASSVTAALSAPLSLSAVVSDAGQLGAAGGAALASLTGSRTTLASATDDVRPRLHAAHAVMQ